MPTGAFRDSDRKHDFERADLRNRQSRRINGRSHSAWRDHGHSALHQRPAQEWAFSAANFWQHGKIFSLYTNAEPCTMCLSAIRWAGFKEVIYGTSVRTIAESKSNEQRIQSFLPYVQTLLTIPLFRCRRAQSNLHSFEHGAREELLLWPCHLDVSQIFAALPGILTLIVTLLSCAGSETFSLRRPIHSFKHQFNESAPCRK